MAYMYIWRIVEDILAYRFRWYKKLYKRFSFFLCVIFVLIFHSIYDDKLHTFIHLNGYKYRAEHSTELLCHVWKRIIIFIIIVVVVFVMEWKANVACNCMECKNDESKGTGVAAVQKSSLVLEMNPQTFVLSWWIKSHSIRYSFHI